MDWSPEAKALIEEFKLLDPYSQFVCACMIEDGLPIQTVRKLLPLAEQNWANAKPDGALAFFEIDTPEPHVRYYEKSDSIQVGLVKAGHRNYVLPLGPIFQQLAKAKGKGKKPQ